MMWLRRRCVVCGLHVRRSDWRARVLVEGRERWVVAHHRCVSPSDAMIRRFSEGAR